MWQNHQESELRGPNNNYEAVFVNFSHQHLEYSEGKERLESWMFTILWGAVAQWIERATDNRVVASSNPTETAWKLWQFPLPHFASVFRKRH